MADNKATEIEKKKQELEQELARIQDDLDKSIDGVREDVSSNLDPKNIIRKYPLPVVGASVLAGFLLGRDGKKRTGRNSDSDGVGTVVTKEIRNALTKKGISLLLDYIDAKVSELKSKNEKES